MRQFLMFNLYLVGIQEIEVIENNQEELFEKLLVENASKLMIETTAFTHKKLGE